MARKDFDVVGFQELDRALKQLPKNIEQKVLRNIAGAGVRALAKQTKANAPVETGKLRKNITTKTTRAKMGKATGYVVIRTQGKAADAKNAFYWRFVEFGTSKMSARPFIRPALDQASGRALDQARKAGIRGVEREATKLGRRAKR